MNDLMEFLKAGQKKVHEYLGRKKGYYNTDLLREGIYHYFTAGGKGLRPGLVRIACGALGGDPENVIPAAAAVECFHTWTLVHDDIIDQDDLRRGQPTAHKYLAKRWTETVDEKMAKHGGLSIAILAGDCQHGLVVNCLADLSKPPYKYPPELVIDLINTMETDVLNTLIVGEADDVIYSRTPIRNLSINKIETMLLMKTAKLFEFCVAAGAALAQKKWDPKDKYQASLVKFAGDIGLAFQLQDDLLGIIGDESKLGKPVGSDIQEGKRTTLVLHAYENGSDEDRNILENSLGSKDFNDTKSIIELFERTGSIDYLRERTSVLYKEAISSLSVLEDSIYKNLLIELAEKMIKREK